MNDQPQWLKAFHDTGTSSFIDVLRRDHPHLLSGAALRAAVRAVLGWNPPRRRAEPPTTGIYALPEWRNLIGPRHFELDRIWLSKNV